MAHDIESSISELRVAMNNMARQIQSTGAFSFSSLGRSNAYAKVQSLINTASKIDHAMDAIKRAGDILRAQEAMRRNPGVWKTTSEYLDSEKRVITRRNKLQDALLGISDPSALKRKHLEEEYGEEGAARISAAETYARIDEARKKIDLQKFAGRRAFERDLNPEYLNRHQDLVDKYGGGAEGESFANRIEDRERLQRRSSMRWRQRANLAKLDMSDYDLFIHEHKADYGGVKGADDAYRKMLLKQLPPFFKDSKLSTKTLISMQRVMKSTRGIPFVGPTLNRMISNPVAGAAGLLYAGTIAAFSASDKANKEVVSWQNAANLYGMPNKKFLMAGFQAGYKDPGAISKVYGELTARFGDADMFIQNFGKSFGNMTPLARTLVAKQLGLDENTVALIDILSGNKHLPVNETRAINANKNIVETTKALNLQSAGSVWDFLQGAWDSIPGMSGGKARDMQSSKYVREGVMSDMFEDLDKNVRSANEAAESYDSYESNGGQTSMSQNNSKNVIMNVQIAKVESPDPEGFKNGLENMADSASDGNRALLASFGSGFSV